MKPDATINELKPWHAGEPVSASKLNGTVDTVNRLTRGVAHARQLAGNPAPGASGDGAVISGMWICGLLSTGNDTIGAVMAFDPLTLESSSSTIAYTPGKSFSIHGCTGGTIRFGVVDASADMMFMYNARTMNLQNRILLSSGSGGIPGVVFSAGGVQGAGGNDSTILLCGKVDSDRMVYVLDYDDTQSSGFKLRSNGAINVERATSNVPNIVKGAAIDEEGDRLFMAYADGRLVSTKLSNPSATDTRVNAIGGTPSGVSYRDGLLYVANKDSQDVPNVQRYWAASLVPLGRSHIAPFAVVQGIG